MRSTRWMRRLRSERGAALVEFALVVPLIITLMCATIDFGLCVFTLSNLTAAVREGGRYAATLNFPGPLVNDPGVTDRVYKYIAGMNPTLTQAQVKAMIFVDPPDVATGNIRVRIIGYPYKPYTPLAPLFNLGTVTFNRTAIFRWERAS